MYLNAESHKILIENSHEDNILQKNISLHIKVLLVFISNFRQNFYAVLHFCTLFVHQNLLKCSKFRADDFSAYEVIAQKAT